MVSPILLKILTWNPRFMTLVWYSVSSGMCSLTKIWWLGFLAWHRTCRNTSWPVVFMTWHVLGSSTFTFSTCVIVSVSGPCSGVVGGDFVNNSATLTPLRIEFDTSSTAQGGGGSFKNRKPIGEIGCCESGMAERSHWSTERCLISLTLSLSFSGYLPTYPSIFYVSIYLSISPSIDLL